MGLIVESVVLMFAGVGIAYVGHSLLRIIKQRTQLTEP